MVRLKKNCLVFQTNCGHQVPCSAEWVTLELLGGAASHADPELIRHAAAAVLHSFKEELHRDFVSVAEFAASLEHALRAVGLSIFADPNAAPSRVLDSHLPELMKSAGAIGELFLLPQLRRELARRLGESPQMVRFIGLKPCVKQLAGKDRWCPSCENLSDQIVDYIRTCLQSDTRSQACTLVVK
jgi:hypothetical protein